MEELETQKEKWGRVKSGHLEITSILCKQKEDKNVDKVVFSIQNNTLNERITWTPEIEKVDNTGLIPTLTTIKQNIKQSDLPQIIFDIAQKVKDKKICNIECNYSTIEKEKYTILFFKAEDLKSIKIL